MMDDLDRNKIKKDIKKGQKNKAAVPSQMYKGPGQPPSTPDIPVPAYETISSSRVDKPRLGHLQTLAETLLK